MSLEAVIIAIDPGKHTGYTVVDLHQLNSDYTRYIPPPATHPKIRGWAMYLREIGTVHEDIPTIEKLNELIRHHKNRVGPDTKIIATIEAFVFTRVSTMGGSHNALEMTGAMKTLCHLIDPKIVVYRDQKPSEAKMITDADLKTLGLKTTKDGQDDHARMAARHAVVMAARIKRRQVWV